MINGNTSGIRAYLLEEMEVLYDMRCERGEFVSTQMIEALGKYTSLLGREISLFISRSGVVMDVSIGEKDNVSLPYMRRRRGTEGISGIRCVHTHPGGSSALSDVDVGTLLSSRLDAMAALAVRDGEAKSLSVAIIGETLREADFYGPFAVYRIPHAKLMQEIELATARVAEQVRLSDTKEGKERAILIGVNATEEEMAELALLADTAGAEVVASEVQNRLRDKGYYVGKGKLKEIGLAISALEADVVIVNDELSAIETKNLEDVLATKIVDRTVLILDIFANNAVTKEGKLQVELAQLQYSLPRLLGTGTMLSRLGGGIGTRGPGESKLEVDRRRIRRRVFELEQEIKKLESQRSVRREKRVKNRVQEIALVGYTNAGKTSLLNALSNAGLYAEDKLFATLDPVTRRVLLGDDREVLFTDTVGFIDKLPHALISAFRSTLEVAAQADLLLHIVDASSPEVARHTEVVKSVLSELGAGDKPILTVYNKADLLELIPVNENETFYVSAKKMIGIDALLAAISKQLEPTMMKLHIELSYSEGAKLAKLQQHAKEIELAYEPDKIIIDVVLPEEEAKKIL